jgi:hypothetical protein
MKTAPSPYQIAELEKLYEEHEARTEALRDLVDHMDNVLDPRGHEDVRLRKHPEPCCHLDWCVVHDMQRRVEKARATLEVK